MAKYIIKVENGFIGLKKGVETIVDFNECLKFDNFENAIGFSSGLTDDYEYLQILDESEVGKF